MSHRIAGGLAIVFGLLLSAAPAVAHHAFATEFDAKKPVKKQGIVTKIQWTNPHTWIYLNVKNQEGVVEHWSFEMGGPGALQGQGWNRDTLKIGDEVSIEGSLARNGSLSGNARQVTMVSTGKTYGAASSQTNQQ